MLCPSEHGGSTQPSLQLPLCLLILLTVFSVSPSSARDHNLRVDRAPWLPLSGLSRLGALERVSTWFQRRSPAAQP